MKLKQIEKIAERISKNYGMIDREGKPFVIAEKRIINNVRFVEVRTELPSYKGGDELIVKVEEKLGYSGENLGGCIYRFFKEETKWKFLILGFEYESILKKTKQRGY